jgi:hypothetical protein
MRNIAETERVKSGRHGRSGRDYAPLERGCRLRCRLVGCGVGFGGQVSGVSPVAWANCHVSVYCWNFTALPSAMSPDVGHLYIELTEH